MLAVGTTWVKIQRQGRYSGVPGMGMESGPPVPEQSRVSGEACVYTCVRRCVNRCEPVSRGDVKMWKVRIQNGMRGQKSGPCRVTGAQSHQEAPQADRRVS